MARRRNKKTLLKDDDIVTVEDSNELVDTESFIFVENGDKCFSNDSILILKTKNFEIESIEFLTPHITGEIEEFNSEMTSIKLKHSYFSTKATIKVTQINGNSEEFVINLCSKLPKMRVTIN